MRAALASLVLLLAACNREPSFDERYARAEKSIRDKARDIDADLARRENLASEAAAAPPPPGSPRAAK